jgi:superfamily II DNA or RNA helicase
MNTTIKVGKGIECKNLPLVAIKKIKKDLTFKNPLYVSAMKRGAFIPADMPAKIVLYDLDEEQNLCWLPRGYLFYFLKFLRYKDCKFEILDHTLLLKPLNLKFIGKLKKYQEIAEKKMLMYPVGVLEASTGSGKTVVGISLIVKRRQPTLIIVHGKELMYQWRDQIKKFTGEDCGLIGDQKYDIKPITVGIINSVNNHLDDLTNDRFGHIIVDECFVKGTSIDGIPIEKRKVGDLVNSFNHETNQVENKKVTKVFKNYVKDTLVKIVFKNKKNFICTPDHPIFNCKTYLTASSFNDRCTVLSIDNLLIGGKDGKKENSTGFMFYVQKNNCLRKQRRCSGLQKFRSLSKKKTLLFFKMPNKNIKNSTPKNRGTIRRIQQNIFQRKNEKKQSHAHERGKRESQNNQEDKWYPTYLERKKRRKWHTHFPTRKNSNSLGMGNRSCCSDCGSFVNRGKKGLVQKKESPHLLQSGCRKQGVEDCNRDRWGKSQTERESNSRQKERLPLKMEGVESVTIYKRGSGSGFEKMCPDGFVYNIEVEDNHNYFAEGVLVHNCHRSTAETWAYTIQEFSAKHYLGLTATAYRRDGLGHAIFASIGPKIHQIDKKMLNNIGAVLVPDVFKIYSSFEYMFLDDYSTMIKTLTKDEARNHLICNKIAQDLKKHNQAILIVSDRKKHCETLQKTLLQLYGINGLILIGGKNKKEREKIVSQIRSSQYKILFSTISLIGEGFDLDKLSCIFLTTPIKFTGRLIQVIGRVLRPNKKDVNKIPRVYDVRDNNVRLLEYSGYNRDRLYKKEWG